MSTREGGGAKIVTYLIWMAATLALTSCSANQLAQSSGKNAGAPVAKPPAGVSCLGLIEPKSGLLHINAEPVEGKPPIVAKLEVEQGSHVIGGQVLAVLQGRDSLETTVREDRDRIQSAEEKLAQVKEGPKQGDVDAQQALIARLQSAVEDARARYARYRELREKEDVSGAELESKKLALDQAVDSVDEARAKLKSLLEIRPSDIALAETNLRIAQADEQRAQQDLAQAVVRAPAAGQVIAIHARAGAEIGSEGLLDMVKDEPLEAVAEVFETDVPRVHLGEHAVITTDDGQRGEGTVALIGQSVRKSQVLPTDPAAFTDGRVVEVRILLADDSRLLRLIRRRVSVSIQP
jgi:HlyD family secretion protein